MEIKPIRSEADYKAALVDIEQYFDREPEFGTAEADRFDVLAALIGAYEDEHHAIEAPDTVTAIAEVMALRGHTQADLGRLIGSRSRASEIMNRKHKRLPTRAQARKLHEEWGVPAASLLATEKTPQTGVAATRRVEAISQARQRPDAALKRQIEELRRAAYDDGYAAAVQAIREFAAHPTATATAAPRRQRNAQAKLVPRQIRRGKNARHITEAMMTLPNHSGPAAAIKKVLAGKGHDLPYSSIRHGLDQLQARGEVSVAADGRTWSYTTRQR